MLRFSTCRVLRLVLFSFILLLCLYGCSLLPNRAPTASFIVHFDVTDHLMIVDLDASSSSDPDGDAIASYLWSFGQNDVLIVTPLVYSATVPVDVLRVEFPGEASYDIQLLVIDERGAASPPVTQTIVLPNPQLSPMP